MNYFYKVSIMTSIEKQVQRVFLKNPGTEINERFSIKLDFLWGQNNLKRTSNDLCSIKRPHRKFHMRTQFHLKCCWSCFLVNTKQWLTKKGVWTFKELQKCIILPSMVFFLSTTQLLGKFVTSFDKSRRRSRVENVAWILREIRAQFWACCI